MRPFDQSSFNNPRSNSRPKPILQRTTNNNPRLPRPSEYLKAPTFFAQPRAVPPPTPPARPPLRARDNNNNNNDNQNAPSSLNHRKPTITTTTTSASTTRPASSARIRTMPIGGGDNNNNNNRPRQPQLSAAAARALNRPPLTPKVAATKQQPAVSPLAGRRSQGAKDDTASPFLANVTGRSGPRQNRVESANSTPSGTPNPDKSYDSWEGNSASGLGVSSLALDGTRFGPQTEQQQQQDTDSKFFYASDARPTSQGSTQRPTPVPQKPTTFFYANGSSAESRRTISPPSNNPTFTPTLTTTPEPTSTKFFYANGTPDYGPRPGLTASASGSTVSGSSRMAGPRPATGNSAPAPGPPVTSRPMSPVKAATTPSAIPSLQGSALPPGPLNRPAITSPPSLAPAANVNGRRRVSIEAPPRETPRSPRKGHARTGSVPTLDQLIVPKYARSPQSPETTSPPLSPGMSRPAMTMASLLQAAEDLRGEDDSREDDSPPEVHSPTKSIHSNDPISELVANARRERKVQDLEITNASLEAINRTLERQLRKQTAELRRYRRLSRSGRFSGASSRVVSAAMTDPPVDLSDLSEEGHSDMDEQEDSFHESDFSSDEAESGDDPSSPNTRMAVRRKRDEIRLQLDLTKHQELLIDSQKINQSIKRCLDWTEVLIKEGQKALTYHVRVSDVELGGHVLAPPDEEEEEEGESSHEGDVSLPNPSSTLEPLPKAAQDRDSGIELPVDGG